MNKVIMIGRLGKDPEVKSTTNGNSVASFSLAVVRDYKGSDGKRATDWISCTAWRATADFIAKYFKKGSKIAIVGSIQTRSYEAQDGSKRSVCEVVVDSAEFVESKGGAGKPESTEFTPVDDDELPF